MLFFVLTFIFLLISILLSIYGLLFTSPKWLSTLAVTSIPCSAMTFKPQINTNKRLEVKK